MRYSIRPGQIRPNARLAVLAAALGAFFLAGCMGGPGSGRLASSDPLVVTEDGIAAGAMSPERAAAIAEIRAGAAAANASPPTETAAQQTIRLAAREEPRSLAEAQAIEAELALIAERRAGASPGEVAALEARAAELRRLAAQTQATKSGQ